MLTAADYRSEKGRINLTVNQLSSQARVSPNTIVKLLNDEKNGTVTLDKARLVMDYMKGVK